MKYPGMALFALFFGISLLDAYQGSHWLRVAFWLALGLAFWWLESRRGPRTGPM